MRIAQGMQNMQQSMRNDDEDVGIDEFDDGGENIDRMPKLTIRVQASMNYQVAEITAELPAGCDPEYYASTKEWVRNQATDLVREMSSSMPQKRNMSHSEAFRNDVANDSPCDAESPQETPYNQNGQSNGRMIARYPKKDIEACIWKALPYGPGQEMPLHVNIPSPDGRFMLQYDRYDDQTNRGYFYSMHSNETDNVSREAQRSAYYRLGFPKYINMTTHKISGGGFAKPQQNKH